MPIALHHLLDANTEYAEVDLRNASLAIHALFEAWADANGQREIIAEQGWRELEKNVRAAVKGALPSDDPAIKELRGQLYGTLQRAYLRTGARLQELFFADLNLPVDAAASRGLSRRNKIVHEGTSHSSVDIIGEEDPAVRSLANAAFMRLLGYEGPVYDWLNHQMNPYIASP